MSCDHKPGGQSTERFGEMRLELPGSSSVKNVKNQLDVNYRGILSGLREAIYVKQGGSIKSMNQAFLRLTGFSKAELLDGNAIEAAIHPDDK